MRRNFTVIRNRSVRSQPAKPPYRDEPFVDESSNRRNHEIRNDASLGNSRTFDFTSDNATEDRTIEDCRGFPQFSRILANFTTCIPDFVVSTVTTFVDKRLASIWRFSGLRSN